MLLLARHVISYLCIWQINAWHVDMTDACGRHIPRSCIGVIHARSALLPADTYNLHIDVCTGEVS